MEFAVWAYPWDLLDEGIDSVAERLGEIGVDEITLATNYHTVQTYNPHNPVRSTFFARPSSYFQPDREYGRLEPVPNETMGKEDWVAEIAEGLDDTDVTLTSWTIGCHNSRLGTANPDLALENPYGDSLVFGLCPSKPDVQRYLRTLLADIDARGHFERIELETFDYFYGTGFGWHHEKFHVQLGDLGEFLFGLCFCEACRTNAREAGVDATQARNDAVTALDAISVHRLPHDIDTAGWLVEHPEVLSYAICRTETLAELFGDLREAVSDAELGYYIANLSVEDSWKHGADLDRLSKSVDYYLALAYGTDREAATSYVRTAREMTDTPINAGVLPGHPLIYDEGTLVDIVAGFAENGTERVSFYNYGLLPERSLEWIGAATEPYR